MNFDFSEEQTLIKNSMARYLEKNYDFAARSKLPDSPAGFSAEHWKQYSELGWLAIPFAEQLGGFGGNAIDDTIVMEEFGKSLVLEPYVATVVLFGGLLASSADAANHEKDISAVIDGSLHGALAYAETQSRFALNDVETTAVLRDDNYLLNGNKVVVANGHAAHKIIVSARTAGAPTDSAGITLFCIDAGATGVNKTDYPMIDGHRVANISLQDVVVSNEQIIGELHHGHALLADSIERASIAVCAEALGIMEKLLQTTVAYSQTRKQFGVPIGSFQALQHRMVDMFIACEQTRSLLLRAACSRVAAQEQADPQLRPQLLQNASKDALALKAMVAQAGKLVGDEALQLHGGIGMTDELDVAHFVKRLLRINTLFGDEDYSMREFSNIALG